MHVPLLFLVNPKMQDRHTYAAVLHSNRLFLLHHSTTSLLYRIGIGL